MKTLKSDAFIGGKTNRVATGAEPQLCCGRYLISDPRTLHGLVNFRPQHLLHLKPCRGCGDHDPIFMSSDPPQRRDSRRKRLSGSVASPDRRPPMMCDGLENLILLVPQIAGQKYPSELGWVLNGLVNSIYSCVRVFGSHRVSPLTVLGVVLWNCLIQSE